MTRAVRMILWMLLLLNLVAFAVPPYRWWPDLLNAGAALLLAFDLDWDRRIQARERDGTP